MHLLSQEARDLVNHIYTSLADIPPGGHEAAIVALRGQLRAAVMRYDDTDDPENNVLHEGWGSLLITGSHMYSESLVPGVVPGAMISATFLLLRDMASRINANDQFGHLGPDTPFETAACAALAAFLLCTEDSEEIIEEGTAIQHLLYSLFHFARRHGLSLEYAFAHARRSYLEDDQPTEAVDDDDSTETEAAG